jgi:hypothetical protein
MPLLALSRLRGIDIIIVFQSSIFDALIIGHQGLRLDGLLTLPNRHHLRFRAEYIVPQDRAKRVVVGLID